MWMGGMPPLGYDVKDRKLIVNKSEARVVVDIYRRYLVLKSVRDLRDELAGRGSGVNDGFGPTAPMVAKR
jgi:site-specific DNA recombinase